MLHVPMGFEYALIKLLNHFAATKIIDQKIQRGFQNPANIKIEVFTEMHSILSVCQDVVLPLCFSFFCCVSFCINMIKTYLEAAIRGVLWKKVFLKFSQNSQEKSRAESLF